MKTIVAIHSVAPVGGTFLDWSIHYLSKRKIHFNCKSKSWQPLVDNPLTKQTAHSHSKNHPSGVQALKECLDTFHHNGFISGLHSLYPYYQEYNYWANQLGFNVNNLSNDNWKTIELYQQDELNEIAQICQSDNIKNIEIDMNPRWAPYFFTPRVVPPWLQEITNYHWLSDFAINSSYEKNLEIWDLREKLALDIRPFKFTTLRTGLNRTLPHFYIGTEDLWFAGLTTLPKILDWLELSLDKDRFNKWTLVYSKWQQIQLNSLQFVWQLPKIIDATINNHYHLLPNLTLLQEAMILHCLIYLHNVNIKNWQLIKFPKNTQQLHLLLEHNQHTLDQHYQDVLRTSVDSLRSSTLFF